MPNWEFYQYTTQPERMIASELINFALGHGLSISVHDSEEWTLDKSQDKAEIKKGLATTGEDTLRLFAGDHAIGSVWLIWGNGEELISDYSWTQAEHEQQMTYLCESAMEVSQ